MTDRLDQFPTADDLLGMMDSEVSAARDYAKSVKTFAISMQSDGKPA